MTSGYGSLIGTAITYYQDLITGNFLQERIEGFAQNYFFIESRNNH
jgi:hypothetical protein